MWRQVHAVGGPGGLTAGRAHLQSLQGLDDDIVETEQAGEGGVSAVSEWYDNRRQWNDSAAAAAAAAHLSINNTRRVSSSLSDETTAL